MHCHSVNMYKEEENLSPFLYTTLCYFLVIRTYALCLLLHTKKYSKFPALTLFRRVRARTPPAALDRIECTFSVNIKMLENKDAQSVGVKTPPCWDGRVILAKCHSEVRFSKRFRR